MGARPFVTHVLHVAAGGRLVILRRFTLLAGLYDLGGVNPKTISIQKGIL